jgi:hypothetical protein
MRRDGRPIGARGSALRIALPSRRWNRYCVQKAPMLDRKIRRFARVTAGTAFAIVGVAGAAAATTASGMPSLLVAALTSVVSVAVAARLLYRPGGRVVLVYHSVSLDWEWLPWSDQIAIDPDKLDRQLAFLKRRGFTFIPTAELVAQRRQGATGNPDALVVHFDDGYLDNWVAVYPILKAHCVPATIFVSLDFVAEGESLRPTLDDLAAGRCTAEALVWPGYMNWAEIRALDEAGLIDIQPHGVDHARVPIGVRRVAELGPDNWRALAWLQWRQMPGNKTDWWRYDRPPAVPYGTPVPISAPALSACAWLGDRHETPAELEARIRRDLRACRKAFRERLGKSPQVFCWPESKAHPDGRRIAEEEGYLATTGGRGENRRGEDPRILSRLHVGDRCLGFPNARADLLYLYASIRCFQGYYWWYFVLLPMNLIRRLASFRRKPAQHGPVPVEDTTRG